MRHLLSIIAALAIFSGCQSPNPFAVFGPSTVPPPGVPSPTPYYPQGSSAIASSSGANSAPAGIPSSPPVSGSASVTSPRLSVSAADSTSSRAPGTNFVADPLDREPIRIVENPAAAARTAAVPQPVSKPTPSNATPSGVLPPTNSPSGITPAPPGGSFKTSASVRNDPNVAPATFQSPAGPFVESPAGNGQWRVR